MARGDLGIETPLEKLPGLQRRIVAATRRRGKPVVIATQVLESMVHESRPTRAEVTDAAHAVDEGVDAVMLAGETAVGRYPVRSVETLAAILVEAERVVASTSRIPAAFASTAEHAGALAESAVMLAEHAGAAAIVAMTRHGRTAVALAACRPRPPILAVTSESAHCGAALVDVGCHGRRDRGRVAPGDSCCARNGRPPGAGLDGRGRHAPSRD